MIISPSQIEITKRGYASGFVVKYNSATDVTVTAGTFEANNRIYTLSADATHAMTSLASAFDIHYIYLDDSASSAGSPVFIDSITEPVFNIAKSRWYNGDDRCVGAIHSPTASATIQYFKVNILGDGVIEHILPFSFFTMAVNLAADDAWKVPTLDGDSITPVNATAIHLLFSGRDAGAETSIYAGSVEWIANLASINSAQFRLRGGAFLEADFLLNLGISRKIKIAGALNDDNALVLFGRGWRAQF